MRDVLRSAEQWLYGHARSEKAHDAAASPRSPWSVHALASDEYCLIVSWRRDGRAVPTPVWFAADGERVVFRSAASDGKVKRMRREPRVLVCGCTFRGRPRGPVMEGVARFLEGDEAAAAEGLLRERYGLQRRAYAFVRDPLLEATYVEVTSARGRDAEHAGDDALG